jgi:PAS domain S-box-containing protein
MPANLRLHTVFRENHFTEADLVKMVVILSFVMVSLMMTANALEFQTYPFYPLICCIPIFFVSLWFPRHGVILTALIIGGFMLVHAYYSMLGFTVDLVVTGLYATMFFWVLGATTLFGRNARLTVSRYQRLIENAQDAKFLCEEDSLRLLCVNQRCADILGYAAHELVGLPAEMFWADLSQKEHFINEMRREGYIGNMEMTLLSKSGDAHVVLLSCRALLPENLFECTLVDIGYLRGEREDLLQSNGHLQRLIHHSHDIFFMQDVSGRFLHFYWLRAPEYNLDTDAMVGQTAVDLLPGDLAEQHMQRVKEVLQSRTTVRYEMGVVIGGHPHSFSVTLGPMYGVSGDPVGVVGSARDVTDFRRQKIACMQKEWEIDQWKEFITTMAHELRTPLQPLIGYLRMILDDPEYYGLTAETNRLLAFCLESSEHERKVVDKMLELSLIAMDHVELVISDICVRRLLDTVIIDGGYRQHSYIKNEVPEEVHVWGDSDRLYQVLESLVSNAVKYNKPPKKVWIRYTESNKNHYIMVCDNGIGIPPDVTESIFKPFYIGDAANLNRECGRMGLGLSIAKKYIQMHGGEITVTSEVGEGSTFTVRIPKEV